MSPSLIGCFPLGTRALDSEVKRQARRLRSRWLPVGYLDWEYVMIILGLVLMAAVVVGVLGVTRNLGRGHRRNR